MHISILDLDGSLTAQSELLTTAGFSVFAARAWGPRIRLACSFRRFRQFERALAAWCEKDPRPLTANPTMTFIGSGDFHHVSLALLRRQRQPINLLVIDNHPDWMRFVPFLHCGTWLYHAARLPQVERIYHVGGDVDFDNYYQWMAPWHLLRSGKLRVLPAIRCYVRGGWSKVTHQSIRTDRYTPATLERIQDLVVPFHAELAARPLYISLDKDAMSAREACVNWDSGHLTFAEVESVIRGFVELSGGRLAGMDVVGDWSAVHLQGGLRHSMHWIMHPSLHVDSEQSRQRNQRLNQSLLDVVREIAVPVANECCTEPLHS